MIRNIFYSEVNKLFNYKPIRICIISIVILALLVSFLCLGSIKISSNISHEKLYKTSIIIIMSIYKMSIITCFGIGFYLIAFIERKNDSLEMLNASGINTIKILIIKFLLFYLVYLILMSVFLALYFVISKSTLNPILSVIEMERFQLLFKNQSRHFILLPIPIFLTQYIFSIISKNLITNILVGFLVFILSNYNSHFPNPWYSLEYALNAERSLYNYSFFSLGENLYPYYTVCGFVIILISLIISIKKLKLDILFRKLLN